VAPQLDVVAPSKQHFPVLEIDSHHV